MGDTITTTVALALGSLVIALVLGTALAWAATRLPRRLSLLRVLPILPIVVPAVGSVIGWSFMLSPRPGYLNALMRQLPWWSDRDSGPVDVYALDRQHQRDSA
jgi:iron(III) transport system permease protein